MFILRPVFDTILNLSVASSRHLPFRAKRPEGLLGEGGLVLWVADTDQRRVVVVLLLLLAGADAEQTQAEAFQGGELGLGQR